MSDNNDDPLAKAFGVNPYVQTTEVSIAEPVVDTENQEYAKTQTKVAIDAGQTALSDLLSIAQSSQHPRAYEVVAKLVDTIANASDKLAAMELRQQEAMHKAKGPQGPGTVNNNLFVGNATELLKMLKNNNNQ